ncbi:MAG TPA: GNAT family N-acetyltransferase [Longimicrobium sp.]|nr:GNAT family N-acetyltransferase [Longimicrobium sp.]
MSQERMDDAPRVGDEDPRSPDAVALMDELTRALAGITGEGGAGSFDVADVCAPGGAFVVARSAEGEPLGCGAIRPLSDGVAEVKRMYARPGTRGVGSAVLAFLEARARSLGYDALWLETRRVNTDAVAFYTRRGYRPIDNYGRYAGRAECVCLGKNLGADAAPRLTTLPEHSADRV